MKLNGMLAACAGLALAMTASASAQSGSCKDVAAGMLKHGTVPYHMYTMRADDKGVETKVGEMILAGGVLYLSYKGEWQRSMTTLPQMKEFQREVSDSVYRTYTCTRVGNETVNGVASQRYHVVGKSVFGVQKEDIWLGPGGLMQQIMVNGEDDSGAPGKAYMAVRYVYTNVQAPAGVK